LKDWKQAGSGTENGQVKKERWSFLSLIIWCDFLSNLFSKDVLLYPLDVFRREIQVRDVIDADLIFFSLFEVNNEAVKYNLSPVSVFAVLFKIWSEIKRFWMIADYILGWSALWKCIVTCLVYNGLVVGRDYFLEDIISVKK